jgi:hypothetical protein
MFELDHFVSDCRSALRKDAPQRAVREVVGTPKIDRRNSCLRWRLFWRSRSEWYAETLLEQQCSGEKMARRFEEGNGLLKNDPLNNADHR